MQTTIFNRRKNSAKKSIIAMLLAATFTLCATPHIANASFLPTDEFKVYAAGQEFTLKLPQIYQYGGEKVLPCLDEFVDSIYHNTLIPATDATLTFLAKKDKMFALTPQKNGKCIDKNKLTAKINHAVLCGQNSVNIELIDLYPNISIEILGEQTKWRACFSTYYGSSSKERKHNIALACEAINGSVIEAGQTFSFNNAVGVRCEERGYMNATVISQGEFKEGLGGGVCQVSTTLYNAALLSGMEVVESHHHTLPVSYVEPSFDAMVSYGFCDLKFLNTTTTPIFIYACADGENISITLYGSKKQYSYKRTYEINEIIPAKTSEQNDDTLYVGESFTKGTKKDGYKSTGYLEIYENGELIKTVKLREDYYKATDAVTYIGTKPKN